MTILAPLFLCSLISSYDGQTINGLVDGSLKCKVCILLYEAWVLKNGSLGPAVSMQCISIFSGYCNCETVMKLFRM